MPNFIGKALANFLSLINFPVTTPQCSISPTTRGPHAPDQALIDKE